MKEEKGITLVALIITIIVLLILAVVTISAVNEGSLFSYANNAAEGYSKAQKEENTMISNWLTELAKHDSGEENPKDYPLNEEDVTGTYYAYGDSTSGFYIELKPDGTGISNIEGMEEVLYTYENGVITLINPADTSQTIPCDFIIEKQGETVLNKIFFLGIDNPAIPFAKNTTNLLSDNTSYIGTYIKDNNSTKIIVLNSDGTATYSKDNRSGRYWIYNNILYLQWNDDSDFISAKYYIITYDSKTALSVEETVNDPSDVFVKQ